MSTMSPNEEFIELRPKRYTAKLRLHPIHDDVIVFRHGHIAITNYKLGDNPDFEKSLSVFDEMRWKYERVSGYYVHALREFRLPRGYNMEMLHKYFRGRKFIVDNNAYPADKIKIKLLVPPRDDEQRVAISFLCGEGDFKQNRKYTNRMLQLNTGSGKTYVSVAATCYMEARAIVIVPFSKLLDQWKESYLQYTTLKKDDIFIVRGSDMIQEVIDGKHKDVKVFIVMSDTIAAFNKRRGDLETIEFFRATNAYLKIVDEVHRDIRAISMIEALSNTHMNFYLSATPGRTDRKENWIFRTCFRHVPKFGREFKTQDEKHINVVIKYYRFIPTGSQINRMVQKQKKWLNSKAYERELMCAPKEQNRAFVDSILMMLDWAKKSLKHKNKILILSETIDGTAFTQSVAEQVFPGKTARYYGAMNKKDKEEALEEDIICATISSLGTGADIKGIQYVFNVATYSSQITATQTAGRARKLKDGTQVWYIEFVNMSYLKTLRQYENHKQALVKLSRTGKLFVIN